MTRPLDTIALPLFVPADRPERIAKAVAAGPDAVFVDLEDAVTPEGKDAARAGLAQALHSLSTDLPVLLRVNAIGTPWHDADLAAAAVLPIAAIVLPKAESADDIAAIARRASLPVIALVESASGLANARSIAAAASRIAFGSIDYAADLAMAHTHRSLLSARSEIVLASRLAGLPAPLDGVTTAIGDETVILEDCAHAVELGFGGKLLIHPAQIGPARQGFLPAPAEIDWARRVIEAAAQGGAIRVDGGMVDAPVVARARQILNRAGVALPPNG